MKKVSEPWNKDCKKIKRKELTDENWLFFKESKFYILFKNDSGQVKKLFKCGCKFYTLKNINYYKRIK
jgi:hypothetical protein